MAARKIGAAMKRKEVQQENTQAAMLDDTIRQYEK